MKKKIFLAIFILAILCVTIAKHVFVSDLPIVANIALGVDDALMINITKHLSNGEWVGGYNDARLSKGLTFPLMLAACHSLNIDYITMMNTLYTLACLLIIWVISKKINNKFFLFVIYTVLLFTPIMYSYQVMQRIYRNAIIPSFAILIITGYIYLLLSRNNGKYFLRILASILTGVVLALFWYTREDSIWMIPYIAFMSLSLIVAVLVKNKKINLELFKNLILLIIPIVLVFGYRHILCVQNEKHFGVYTVYNNESYNKAIKSLKKVKKYDYYDNIDFTVEKLKRVAEVSCLKQIYPTLEGLVYGYSLFDSSPEEGEVANGWFPWALKAALNQYGYYNSAENTNLFFNTFHADIEKALAEGKLEYEDVKPNLTMQLKKLYDATVLTVKGVMKYDDIYFNGKPIEYEDSQKEACLEFYEYTGNSLLLVDKESKQIVNLTNNEDGYNEKILNKTNIIENLINIYQKVNLVTFCLAIVLYVIYTIVVFIKLFKKDLSEFEMWAIISGILGAMVTLMMGIAYETAFNAYVITAMYLSAVYPFMLMFSIIMNGQFIKLIYEFIKLKKEIKHEPVEKEIEVKES